MPLLPLLALLVLPKAAPRKVAVVVGVSGYLVPTEKGKGGFESLRFAHLDAERMAKRLTGLGWEVNLLEGFPDAKATGAGKRAILGALAGLGTGPDDTVLFYFSGHGVRVDGRDYLVPGDGRFDDVSTDAAIPKWRPATDSLLGYDELRDAFETMRAPKRLVIVDACRDEPKIGKDGDAPASRVNQAKLGEVVQVSRFGATSYAVMYSCRPGERSYEDPSVQGGVFTAAWLKALDSGRVTNVEGDVNLVELNNELRLGVRRWSEGAGGAKMSPNMVLDAEDPIVIGRLKAASGGSAVLLPTRARLVVTTDAAGATVSVDGQRQPGLTYEVEVGAVGKKDVRVEVSAPGKEIASYAVTLEAGKETPVAAELRALPAAPARRKGYDYTTLLLQRETPYLYEITENGRFLYFSTKDTFSVRDSVGVEAIDGSAHRELKLDAGAEMIALSPNGALGAVKTGNDKSKIVGLWDLKTGTRRAVLTGHPEEVRGGSFTTDGARLITYDARQAIVWDCVTGEAVRVIPIDFLAKVQISSMGGMFLTISNGIKCIPIEKGGKESVLLSKDSIDGDHIEVSHDERYAMLENYGAKVVKIWDLQAAKAVGEIHLNPNSYNGQCMISPDGKVVAVGSFEHRGEGDAFESYDHKITFYRVPDGQRIRTLEGYYMFDLRAEGLIIAYSEKKGLWKTSIFRVSEEE